MSKVYDKTFSRFCNEKSCKDCKYGTRMNLDCEEMWQLERDTEIRAAERAKVLEEVCEKIIPLAKCRKDCKAMEKECVHCMMVKLDKIEEELEQLKEKK